MYFYAKELRQKDYCLNSFNSFNFLTPELAKLE